MINVGFTGNTPVQEGDEIDVEVISTGSKGDGIAKVEGYVLMIPDTKPGDMVRVKVMKTLNKFGFAEVVA